MIPALMQPVFAPNLYDLACIKQAGRVFLADTHRWSRKGRVHRAVIRTPQGITYINIPVVTEDRKKPIHKVRIDQTCDWITPLLRTLSYNYRNARYFDFYEPEIRADFQSGTSFEYLHSFALHLRYRLYRYLELPFEDKEVLLSRSGEYPDDPDKLIGTPGTGKLFQEHSSRHYMKQSARRVDPQFSHPVYYQHFEGFEKYCWAFDLLFQMGPESFKILDQI